MKLFDKLMTFVEQLPKALENFSDAIRSAKKGDAHHGDVEPLRVQAEIRFADADVAKHRANQDEQTSIQHSIRKAAWAAFFAAFGYAGISFCQWQEMQRQTIIQRNASMLTERAWAILSSGSVEFSEPDAKGLRTFAVPIEIKNVGKTPAKNMFAEVVVDTFPNEGTWIARYKNQATTAQIANIVMADSSSKFSAALKHITDHLSEKTTLLSEGEWKQLTGGDSYIVVYGRMTYMDSFGRWHWQHFCSWATLAAGGVSGQNCTAYNNMDEANLNDKGDEGPPKNDPYIKDGKIQDAGRVTQFATQQ
jgi:hypothetical protein